MKFTDIFIKRPVLATVISLLILVLGIRSVSILSLQEFPSTESGIITIETPYVGADPEVIESFITTTMEGAIAQSNGIDYMTSVSSQGISIISVFLHLNYDTDKALTEITSNISSVVDQLPPDSQAPEISIDVNQATDLMYIAFYSDVLSLNQITDYIARIAQPRLRAVHQVLDAELLGQRPFALRAWLDPQKLAAFNLTPTDVFDALEKNDFLSAAGRSDGNMLAVNININTNLKTVDEFRNLIIGYDKGAVIKLEDLGTVSLGAEEYDAITRYQDKNAVFIGMQVVPDGNVVKVIGDVNDVMEELISELPDGLKAKIVYDVTDYIDSAINEVLLVLLETIIIVILVIFSFLGSVRSAIIPIVAIPLSLIGSFFVMYLLGYSINLLTLLSLVLAIGLVVDDAIIVVENIDRHIREGMSSLQAAITGARELANPIIAITVVLVSVYLPIGFVGGFTGILFVEFAFTLAGAIVISAIVALTLSPMMCAMLMTPLQTDNHRVVNAINVHFENLREKYKNALSHTFNYSKETIVFCILIVVSIMFLYTTSKTELAPAEDQGLILVDFTASPNASVYQTALYSKDLYNKMSEFEEIEHIFQLDGVVDVNGRLGRLNTSLSGLVFKPWDERKPIHKLMPKLQEKADEVTGAKIALYQPSPLPGTIGFPVQFAITTTKPYAELHDVSTAFLNEVREMGLFSFVDNDLRLDMLQAIIEIDRPKAAALGLSMTDIGDVIAGALSQEYVNFFALDGRAYQVIPQVMRKDRLNYDQVLNYYVTTQSGESVPLSTIATTKTVVVPESLNHFHELHSATIFGVLNPSVTMGEALNKLEQLADRMLPDGYEYEYGGESRNYKTESAALPLTFLFSMIIIFLALAALFESFRDPFIILISVPLSIFGALLFINLEVGGASLNIYTQVGLVTLIGLISKHGILIVQFANALQMEGKNKLEAISMAASIRLRPILMTTGAMVLGVIPLLIASGPGAAGRFNIGLVIFTGVSIGTLFTLFVLPTMYLLLAKTHNKEEIIS